MEEGKFWEDRKKIGVEEADRYRHRSKQVEATRFLPVAKNRSFISWEQRSNVEENWLVSKPGSSTRSHSDPCDPISGSSSGPLTTRTGPCHGPIRISFHGFQPPRKRNGNRSKHVASSDSMEPFTRNSADPTIRKKIIFIRFSARNHRPIAFFVRARILISSSSS